jgi:hypothetical protein
MKMIQLTQNKTTIVDDDDYERYGHLKWHFSHGRAVRRNGWKVKTNQWLHREIMGNPQGLLVDHINGNPLDNRKENLRLCVQSQNMGNARKTTKKTSSVYKGVHRESSKGFKNPWSAYVNKDGKRSSLGHFATEEEAALAYNTKAEELFGEFANLNVITKRKKQ